MSLVAHYTHDSVPESISMGAKSHLGRDSRVAVAGAL